MKKKISKRETERIEWVHKTSQRILAARDYPEAARLACALYDQSEAIRKTATIAHDAATEMGRLGGAVGGHARAAKLSPERRKEIARNAANARWAKFRLPQLNGER